MQRALRREPERCSRVMALRGLQIRPTKLPWPALYDLAGALAFVSNAITYEPLENDLHMPDHLFSPASTLSFQAGDAFDMSVLLVSILTGAGYDAYVVVGYAPCDVVHNDQSRSVCPLLEAEASELEAARERVVVGGGGSDAPSGKYTCGLPSNAYFCSNFQDTQLDVQHQGAIPKCRCASDGWSTTEM